MKAASVFHIISSTNVGGAEMMLKKYLNCKHRDSTDVIVISLTGIGDIGRSIYQELDIKVLGLKMDTLAGMLTAIPKFLKLLFSHKPRFVISWMYHANLFAFFLTSFGNYRRVWNIRCGLSDIAYWPFKRRLVLGVSKIFSSRVDKVIFNSHRAKDEHVKYGFKESNISVVYNGFNQAEYDISTGKLSRKTLGIPKSSFLIGSFGRNVQVKRMHDLLNICKELRSMNIPTELLFIGRFFDTEVFQKKINDANLDRYVHIIREVKIIAPYYKLLDAFCLCSESEGFPNVVGEAAYSKVPIIASDISDLKRNFLETWQVSDIGEISGFVKSALKIYKMDNDEKQTLVQSQYNRYSNLTEINYVCNLLSMYFINYKRN